MRRDLSLLAALVVLGAFAGGTPAGAAAASTFRGSTGQGLPVALTVDVPTRRVISLSVRYRCGRSSYTFAMRRASGLARLGKRGDFRYAAPRSSRMTSVSGRVAGAKISGHIAATRKGCRVFAVFAARKRSSNPPKKENPTGLRCRAPQLPALVNPEGAARHLTAGTRARAAEKEMCWPPLTYSGNLDQTAAFSEERHSEGGGLGTTYRNSSRSARTTEVGGTATFMLAEAWSPPNVVGRQPNGVVGTYKLITPNISWTLLSVGSKTEEQVNEAGTFWTTETCTEGVVGASSKTPEAIGTVREDGRVSMFLNMPPPPTISRCVTTFSDGRPNQERAGESYVRGDQVGPLTSSPGTFLAEGFVKDSYGGRVQGTTAQKEGRVGEGSNVSLAVTASWDLKAAP